MSPDVPSPRADPEPAGRSSLARHASAVAGLTLLSRVLGFARDAAVAALFGTGMVADAAAAGLAVPQLARRLLGEGALNAAILPRLPKDARPADLPPTGEGARHGMSPSDDSAGSSPPASGLPAPLAGALILAFTLAAAALAGLMVLFMPQVTAVLAPGFLDDPARMEGAVLAGRIAAICLPLATCAGVIGALANAAGRVTRPAFAPAAGNVAVLAVVGVLAFAGTGHGSAGLESAALALLAVAAVAGALAQLAVIGAACPFSLGAMRPDRAALAAALPMLMAAGPTLFAAALPQLRILAASAVASGVDGGVAALFYATRLVELPLGLVGASAGAVLLPALARSGGQEAGGRGLEAALILSAPAAAGLMVLAEPIVRVLFERGAFDAHAGALTAQALAILALSLPVQALERILATIAFAHGFGRHVTRASLAGLLLGGLAGFLAAGPLGLAGPALGVLVSSLVSLAGLWGALARAGRLRPDRASLRRLGASLAAAALMGAAVAAGAQAMTAPLAAGGVKAALALAALVALGMVVYGGAAMGMGALPVRIARLWGGSRG